MNIFGIFGVGLVAAALSLILKQYHPPFSLLVSLAAGILIFMMLASEIVPILDRLQAMIAVAAVKSEEAQVLFKALGITLVTQLSADVCRDSNETAIASKIETAGKIAVLAISFPLFEKVFNMALSLLNI